jgi:hypothetical protein
MYLKDCEVVNIANQVLGALNFIQPRTILTPSGEVIEIFYSIKFLNFDAEQLFKTKGLDSIEI